ANVVPPRSAHHVAGLRPRPRSARRRRPRGLDLEPPRRGMTVIRLSKLHATGNDFLVHQASTPLGPRLAAGLCGRHRGIGADGLLTLGPGRDGADCTMILHNADGGEAELSGNGLRCLAYVAARSGLGTADTLVVDTGAGRRVVHLERAADGRVTAA